MDLQLVKAPRTRKSGPRTSAAARPTTMVRVDTDPLTGEKVLVEEAVRSRKRLPVKQLVKMVTAEFQDDVPLIQQVEVVTLEPAEPFDRMEGEPIDEHVKRVLVADALAQNVTFAIDPEVNPELAAPPVELVQEVLRLEVVPGVRYAASWRPNMDVLSQLEPHSEAFVDELQRSVTAMRRSWRAARDSYAKNPNVVRIGTAEFRALQRVKSLKRLADQARAADEDALTVAENALAGRYNAGDKRVVLATNPITREPEFREMFGSDGLGSGPDDDDGDDNGFELDYEGPQAQKGARGGWHRRG